MHSTELLTELQRNLAAQSVSLLIGSGFSRNVSPLFPDWPTLLADMARELYEAEIRRNFDVYLAAHQDDPTKMEYEAFLREELSRRINNIGYLRIVSDYHRQQGFREVVEHYIEERIPKIIVYDGKKVLRYFKDGLWQDSPLEQKDFQLPAQLLALPWLNVFTTNYDHVLDNSVDMGEHDELQREIDDMRSLLPTYTATIAENEREMNLATDELFSLQHDVDVRTDPHDTKAKKIRELQEQIWKIKASLKPVKSKFKKLTKRIEVLAAAQQATWTLIKHSSELALKKNRNIIQIHGRLRNSKSDPFHFDGDAHRCYIAEQEDYNNYPQQHEAFTQLMRISLLRDTFCLIGFSGDDPNFLSWVQWVRDIVMRNPSAEGKKIKIYFVDISGKSVSQARQMFFDNHRIGHISLDNRTIDWLAKEAGRPLPDRSDKAGVLRLLIHFFGDQSAPDMNSLRRWRTMVDDYHSLWQSIMPSTYTKFDISKIVNASARIQELKRQMPFADAEYKFTVHRQLFFEMAVTLVNAAAEEDDKKSVLELLRIASQEILVPASSYLTFDEIDHLIDASYPWSNIHHWFIQVAYASAIWENKQELASGYQSMLPSSGYFPWVLLFGFMNALMHFRFSDARKLLANWAPEPASQFAKFTLLSLFEPKTASAHLSTYETRQPQEWALQLAMDSHMRAAVDFVATPADDRSELLSTYSADTFMQNGAYLIGKVLEKKKKVQPAGEGAFLLNRSLTLGTEPKVRESIAFFWMLGQHGIPLASGGRALYGLEDILQAALLALQYHPLPVVSLVLQTGDVNLCRVVAQQLIYHANLKVESDYIFKHLVEAVSRDEMPKLFRHAAYSLLSELYIAYEPAAWQGAFEKAWFNNEAALFQQHARRFLPFQSSGLFFIQDADLLAKVVVSCLSHRNLERSGPARIYLASLMNNSAFKKHQQIIAANAEVRVSINDTIGDITEHNSEQILILKAIQALLTTEQRKQIQDRLKTIDFTALNSEDIWKSILYFANGDEELHKKSKIAIIQSRKLWDSGIADDLSSTTATNKFIPLERLTHDVKNPLGLQWEKQELEQITVQLREEFNKITAIIAKQQEKGISFHNYENILEEMLCFLQRHSKVLVDKIEPNLFLSVEQTYFQQRGFTSIGEGILSTDKNVVLLALIQLETKVHLQNSLAGMEIPFQCIITRVSLQGSEALAESIHCLVGVVSTLKHSPEILQFAPLLVNILRKYQYVTVEGIEMPYLHEHMMKIASTLNFAGLHDEAIDYWVSAIETSPFLNIKLATWREAYAKQK